MDSPHSSHGVTLQVFTEVIKEKKGEKKKKNR